MTVVGWTSAVKQSHCVSDDGYLLNVTHEHRADTEKTDSQARGMRKKENRQRRTELVKMKKKKKKRFNK